jgi:CheY-like chemotaxis protein
MSGSILIVDDDTVFREVVRAVLESADYQVYEAEGGEAALAQIRSTPLDLVILDLVMPGLDGFEVIRHLGLDAHVPPILAISGLSQDEPAELQEVRAFVFGYLAKPFSNADLLEGCRYAVAAWQEARAEAELRDERRQEPRKDLYVSAIVRSSDGKPHTRGRILNLSPLGAELELGVELRPGYDLRLSFDIPGGGGSFSVQARVQWARKTRVGVRFVQIPAADEARLRTILPRKG